MIIRHALMTVLAAILMVSQLASTVEAVRIKDLANIQGVRTNQLFGFGLVIGS